MSFLDFTGNQSLPDFLLGHGELAGCGQSPFPTQEVGRKWSKKEASRCGLGAGALSSGRGNGQ